MKRSFEYKLYISLSLGLILLLGALLISYNNIQVNNKLLTQLNREQIKLNYYTNLLNLDIKKTQVNLLQKLLLHHSISKKVQESQKIATHIKKLEKYGTNSNISKKYLEVLQKIKNRLVSYQFVRKSLIIAVKQNDTIDIQDALMGFNSISKKFEEDIQTLRGLANAQLYQKLSMVKQSNKHSSNLLLFSFALTMLLLGIAFYKFYNLQIGLLTQLKRAKKAESELKESEIKLLSYNQNLEKEVSEKSDEILKNLYTHPISDLANRNKLLEDISEYNFNYMAILNIDKFQSFNDVYGEDAGNEALKFSGRFLYTAIQKLPFMLYHMGGDEFSIVSLHNISIDEQKFIALIEQILTDYSNKTFVHGNMKSHFKMSAGISYSKDKKMLAYADMALKDAKQKNIMLSVFNEDKTLEKFHKDDMQCRVKINYALEHNTILSYFQPIVPIQDTAKATKYESLVRLKDKDGKIIAPFHFLDVAKRHKLYHKISYRVINNTLTTIQKYKIPCSLNISLADLDDEGTMQYLENTLERFEYKHLLTIELLETEDFQNYDLVSNFCQKMKHYGIKIALDDFGSGYSNFSHALKLPIDFIKIDATLISKVDKDAHSKIMVETIVDLAKRLHVETIAEFVASQEILDTVKALGVDYAQGYHLGKPLPIEEHIKS